MIELRNWLPQMDSHHQPPDPKSGALLIELQGNVIRQPELHRSLADTSGVRRSLRFGGILFEKWSGTSDLHGSSPHRMEYADYHNPCPVKFGGATRVRTAICAMP